MNVTYKAFKFQNQKEFSWWVEVGSSEEELLQTPSWGAKSVQPPVTVGLHPSGSLLRDLAGHHMEDVVLGGPPFTLGLRALETTMP